MLLILILIMNNLIPIENQLITPIIHKIFTPLNV